MPELTTRPLKGRISRHFPSPGPRSTRQGRQRVRYAQGRRIPREVVDFDAHEASRRPRRCGNASSGDVPHPSWILGRHGMKSWLLGRDESNERGDIDTSGNLLRRRPPRRRRNPSSGDVSHPSWKTRDEVLAPRKRGKQRKRGCPHKWIPATETSPADV